MTRARLAGGMADAEIIILNQPGLTRRVRTSGRVQFTTEVKSEPLIHTFDPKTLGGVVAKAIAEELRKKVKAITATVSASTKRARDGYLAGFVRGTASSKRRYSGGRIGSMPPQGGDIAFNDSGRMEKSIQAQPRDDSWTISMAANRLDPATAGGELAVQRIYRRLVELVPAFADTKQLFQEQGVREAVDQSLEAMIVKARETKDQLLEARARQAVATFRATLQMFRAFMAG